MHDLMLLLNVLLTVHICYLIHVLIFVHVTFLIIIIIARMNPHSTPYRRKENCSRIRSLKSPDTLKI